MVNACIVKMPKVNVYLEKTFKNNIHVYLQDVQVKIELGHRATLKKKPTAEGFTHDWSVFVRGPEGNNIQHFVEKVVFHLHDSFNKPHRSKSFLHR